MTKAKERKCEKCNLIKPHKHGNSAWCIDCHQVYKMDWQKRMTQRKTKYAKSEKGKTHRRCHHRLKTYNLSQKEYSLIFYRRQRGKCPICNNLLKEYGREQAIDHDHQTGRVRGVLCRLCNRGIGFFNDDTVRLKRAIRYLRGNKHKATHNIACAT